MSDTITIQYLAENRRQQGSALTISLFILLVLTIIGATALNDSVMEEKMSSNFQQGHLAFQAAESAINKTFIEVSQSRTLVDQADAARQVLADPNDEPNWPVVNDNMHALDNGINTDIARDVTLTSVVRHIDYIAQARTKSGGSFEIMDNNTPAGDIIEIVSTGQLTGSNVTRRQTQGVTRLRPGTGQAN